MLPTRANSKARAPITTRAMFHGGSMHSNKEGEKYVKNMTHIATYWCPTLRRLGKRFLKNSFYKSTALRSFLHRAILTPTAADLTRYCLCSFFLSSCHDRPSIKMPDCITHHTEANATSSANQWWAILKFSFLKLVLQDLLQMAKCPCLRMLKKKEFQTFQDHFQCNLETK